MKCFHCRAELQRGTATFTDSRKGYVIVLHDLPAWVCPQCGEPLFEEMAVEGIQTVLQTLDAQVEKLHQAA
ncbi:MAG: YgiT-type zinc finger protein [Deltaproteobacteria bacterium]|nr:YgiT-type zinc finger protein [Deltaproteobacteria bacterium]